MAIEQMSLSFADEISFMQTAVAAEIEKRNPLRNLDCFILDNSLRESTVGQLRGHTLENKWKIFDAIKRCGMKHIIVGTFAEMTRVDDQFALQLRERGEDFSTLYSFSEFTEGFKDGLPDMETIPVGMRKMKKFSLLNPIIELDMGDKNLDWGGKLTVEQYCQFILDRIVWCKQNLSKEGNVIVNIRDLPFVMRDHPERVLTVVKFLATLPEEWRPFGLNFEELMGRFLPEELGIYSSAVRKVMDDSGWKGAHLLVHIHERWGLAEATQLACLNNGVDGIWASLCLEGGSVGHACSSIALTNLLRLGNRIVPKRYNCSELRKAAIEVTTETTGMLPKPSQVVYGQRALDVVLDFEQPAKEDNINIITFLGEKPIVRLSCTSSYSMIQDQLVNVFGPNPQFTIERAEKMHKVMVQDLISSRKEEYFSKAGLAMLFERSGGKITDKMRVIIDQMKTKSVKNEMLIAEVRGIWDEWDHPKTTSQGDHSSCLDYNTFYNVFMSLYLGCYRCMETKKALQGIDMVSDGHVEWTKLLAYLKWALNEYPEINDVEDLLSVTFCKGVIPCIQEEMLKKF